MNLGSPHFSMSVAIHASRRDGAPQAFSGGTDQRKSFERPGIRGFTLIELILVMAILGTVLAVAAPALGRFFRGRNLDSEAFRFLALLRHGQERAVSEGIPMQLWIDVPGRRYGLQSDPTWSIANTGSSMGNSASTQFGTLAASQAARRDDPNSVEFEFAADVDFEIQVAISQASQGSLEIREVSLPNRVMIRFQPDGFLPSLAPDWILFKPKNAEDAADVRSRVWIAPDPNRISYEIWTQQPPVLRR